MKQLNLQVNLRKKFTKQGVKMIAPETVFFRRIYLMTHFWDQVPETVLDELRRCQPVLC